MPTFVRDRGPTTGAGTDAPEVGEASGTSPLDFARLAVAADIFVLKQTHFVLWRGGASGPPPRLITGRLQPGSPVSLAGEQQVELSRSDDVSDLT